MKRLKLIGSWKRIGVQAGLLAGLGLAFIGNSQQPVTAAMMDECPSEGQCTFKKPNFLIIADYSASMNQAFGQGLTRWEAAEAAIINLTTTDNAFFDKNLHLALMRFGHDPSASMGTTIPGDVSNPPITDGQALDVYWYDPMANDKSFFECNGQALVDALNNDIPPPVNGMMTGIGTWTKGALDRAKALIAASKADHAAEDMGKRFYANMVMTDGSWTSQAGTQTLTPPAEDPSLTSGDLFNNQQIPTYVVYFGAANDAMAKGAADKMAMAGGTNAAISAENPDQLNQALKDVVTDIKNQVVIPQCSPGLPRFMILLDASSSMLNVNGGMMAGMMGTTGWDQAREALAGANSIFDVPVMIGMGQQAAAEDVIHLGLTVFGHNQPAPGEQKVVVDYGACHRDNFAWALDPNTSCGNGCNDPWGGPPITWTFLDGKMQDPPGFADKTVSHMPKCDGNNAFCSGSGTYTHLGLQLVKTNQIAYHMAATQPMAPFPADANTVYSNILITDGQYNGYSTDAQVQAELQAMYNAGIITYVIGFGDGVDTPQAIAQLNNMADWGSGNMLDYYDANNQAALEAALKSIIEAQEFDPCCVFNNCSINDEPDDQNQCNPNDPLEDCSANGQMCVLDMNQEWYVCVDIPDANCGNGVVEGDEECDDGNNDNGDGCDANCKSELCGNGAVDGNEQCDDGNDINTDACLDDCTNAACGDGYVQDGVEECDDGNMQDGDGCSALCTDEGMSTTTTGTGGETTNGETTGPTTSAGTSSSGGNTTNPGTTGSNTTGGNSDTDTESDTGATTGGGIDDGEGCNCSVDDAEGNARGLLGLAFGLGLAGFARRRRQA
ncbi:MAG: DUF4215 domain-containing protein [Nannocystaceae bacterium]